jgi:SAM-dependent methyltransferase
MRPAMRRVQSRYLDDGKGFNHGQPATLLEIESDADYDAILDHIVSSGFYGASYLAREAGQGEPLLTTHLWWVAAAAAALRPRRVVELGCGRGDVLRILQDGYRVEVTGIDFAPEGAGLVWPSLRGAFLHGDLLDVLADYDGPRFDLVDAFDIWEHLHPRLLDAAIDAAIRVTTPDALFFFVVPAFGDDPVFGEQFPLEFEENREAFERREPFRFLVTDKTDDRVPALGHLTWAHTDWWVDRFAAHGLVRLPAIERRLHAVLDPFVPHSVRALYVLRRATPEAAHRAARLRPFRAPALAALAVLARRYRWQRSRGLASEDPVGDELEVWCETGVLPLARLRRATAGLAGWHQRRRGRTRRREG